MANRHGRPAREPLSDDDLEHDAPVAGSMLSAVEAHVAVAAISDNIAAVEIQLEELGALYERTKARESYTAAARLSVELRQLQDRLRQLRDQQREQHLDNDDAAEVELVRVLQSLPESMRARVLAQVPKVQVH